MLEKDFNQLDNDFITIWIRLFLEDRGAGDYENKFIESLAEMGQINAIQCWYIYNSVGKNKNIDLVANYYIKKQDDFNIDLIKSHKSCSYRGLQMLVENTINDSERYFRHKYGVDVDEESDVLRADVRQRLPQKEFYSETIKSIERAKDLWLKGDVLAGERMAEMIAGLAGTWPFAEDRGKISRKARTYARQIRKQLTVEYSKNNWNAEKMVRDNPAMAYAFAKNLTSKQLGGFFEVSKKQRKLGKKLCQLLVMRTLSQELVDYTKARDEEKELAKHEKNRKFVSHFLETEATPEKLAQRAREMDGIVDFGSETYETLGDRTGGNYLGWASEKSHHDDEEHIDDTIDYATKKGHARKLSENKAGANDGETPVEEKAYPYTEEELGFAPMKKEDSSQEENAFIDDAVGSGHLKLVNQWKEEDDVM